jgi:hypothetical protein
MSLPTANWSEAILMHPGRKIKVKLVHIRGVVEGLRYRRQNVRRENWKLDLITKLPLPEAEGKALAAEGRGWKIVRVR